MFGSNCRFYKVVKNHCFGSFETQNMLGHLGVKKLTTFVICSPENNTLRSRMTLNYQMMDGCKISQVSDGNPGDGLWKQLVSFSTDCKNWKWSPMISNRDWDCQREAVSRLFDFRIFFGKCHESLMWVEVVYMIWKHYILSRLFKKLSMFYWIHLIFYRPHFISIEFITMHLKLLLNALVTFSFQHLG